MKWLLLFLYLLMIMKLTAQEKLPAPAKVAPTLHGFKRLNQEKEQNFFIVTGDVDKLKQFLTEKKLHQNIVSEYRNSNLFVIRTSWRIIDSIFISSPLITFIDTVRTPKEETIIDGFDLALNKLNLVHDRFKTINGTGTIVSVKENKPDSTDIDLKGRFVTTTSASGIITSHATIMSTIIGGGGNTYTTGKGAAWGASISSSNFANLLPDSDADYKKYSIDVQNHSYGTGIENYYGADAAAYDASTISNPSLLHVFSAGNSGDKSSTSGPYSGIPGFANLTGSFKMAKNILTVGAIESGYNVAPLSSRGPAYDGRVSPQLVAFGQDGSSGAAALVSGTTLLLQQAYKQSGAAQLAPSALIKSVLLNSADDVGPIGIDFQSGYGNLNAYNAMQSIINKNYFSGTIANGEQQTHSLVLPGNVQRLKVTICWNDHPANANSTSALINDIDLRLTDAVSGNSWEPWVLNNFPDPDSLTVAPIRKRDSINNVEQITIDNPSAGLYTLVVNGFHIPQGPQSYYISYQWDSISQFNWQYPTATDQILARSNTILRWKSTFNASVGTLYYSQDGGNVWTLISDKIDLHKSYVQWSTPALHAPVLFKMIVDGHDFVSDLAVISSRLITGVGFNCNDSFSFYWNKVPNISSYTVYRLGNTYLEPLLSTNDTSVVLKKLNNPATHYAVAPVIQGKPALKSYGFNYTTQGTGCYIRNFLVDLISTNAADLLLELGTTYHVQKVVIEKLSRNGFIPLSSISNATILKYTFSDTALLKGGNSYRATIHLTDGQVVYSRVETIYHLPGISYFVFPNPATTSFQLVSSDNDNTELIMYNSTGQKVLSKKITSPVQKISVHQLKKGLYFIVILQKNKTVYQGNLLVQ
jgi:hypothetical protein